MLRYIRVVAGIFLLSATGAAAQNPDGQVLRAGEIRLTVGGRYEGFRTEFFGDGGRQSISAGLGGPLTPANFAPLSSFSTVLATFLQASDSVPFTIADGDVFAGDLSTRLSWNTRTVPLRLSVGVVPRVELGVEASAYRTERFPRRLGLTGGNLGLNPDRPANGTLLSMVDPTGGPVGDFPFLPVEGSAIGAELQRRVFAVTGDSLDLPDEPLNGGNFESLFGFSPFPYALSEWRQGDVEIDARVQLVRTFDEPYYPADSAGVDFRVAAIGGLRVGAGERGQTNPRLDWGPDVGHDAISFGGAADVFAGRWLWVSAGGTYTRISAADVSIATSTEVIPGEATVIVQARREPGAEIDVWLQPQFRLAREISLAGSLRYLRAAEGSQVVAGSVVTIPSRSQRSIGFTVNFTNLPAYQEGSSDLPVEASLGYLEDFSGSVGARARRMGFLRISLLYRLWG